jgi:hypothetical protein
MRIQRSPFEADEAAGAAPEKQKTALIQRGFCRFFRTAASGRHPLQAKCLIQMVGDTGFEPVTPTMSR